MTRLVGLFLSLSLLVAACGAGEDASGDSADRLEVGLGPLMPRNHPAVAAVGTEVLVVGGNTFACGPADDCVQPEVPPLSDGAIFDAEAMSWRSISEAPFGIDFAETTTIGSAVYIITQCEKAPSCPEGRAMVRYELGEDVWERLSPVPGNGYHHLVPVGGELFAVSGSDESPAPDYRYKESSDTWVPLEPSPMVRVFDRFAVAVDGQMVVYGSPIDGESRDKIVAAYDPKDGSWEELDPAPSGGWQVFNVDDVVILNPHFGLGSGGIHDVGANAWSALPEAPSSDQWQGDIAGVIGARSAQYEYPRGWMLDLRTDGWIFNDTSEGLLSGAEVAAVGQAMFVVGGHYWTNDEQRVDGEATLWTPPEN